MTHPVRTCVFRPLGLVALLVLAGPSAVLEALVAPAHAAPEAEGVPVSLPAGQKAAEWADALAARGLVVAKAAGLPATGPGVAIADEKDHWEMLVRSRAGTVETVNLAPCTTPEEREDLLFYASTLLGPAPAIVMAPVAAAPAPAPVAPPPVAAAPPPAPIPVASAPPPAPAPVKAPAAPATTSGASTGAALAPRAQSETQLAGPSTPTMRPDAGPGPWVSAGLGVGVRSAAGTVADVRVDGGWYLSDAVRLGAGLGVRTASALPEAGLERTMRNVDLIVGGAWLLPLAPTPYLGAYVGVGVRTFADTGDALITAAVPILGGELGVDIPLGKLPLHLAPSARAQGDLRSVELRSESGSTLLSPVEFRAAVALVYRPG